MQHCAEMPKSVVQGVSLGTKLVPASGLVLPAAVWVTDQWEVLVEPAVAESFGGDFLSVTFHPIERFGKCDPRIASGPGVYSYLHCMLVLNIATVCTTRSWCVCHVTVLRTV
jgi:hypothetical protein